MPEDGSAHPSPDCKRMGSTVAPPQIDAGHPEVILDSGSAVHATGDASVLTEARAPRRGDASSVTRRDGGEMAVAAVGSVRSPRLGIRLVHYAPGLGPGRVLVSVSQLALCGLAVMFCASGCSVVDRTGAVVGEGRMQGDEEGEGFYLLDFLRVPSSSPMGDPPDPCPAHSLPPPHPAASNPCLPKNPFLLQRVPHEPAPPHSIDETSPANACS